MPSVKDLWDLVKTGATVEAKRVIMDLQDRDLAQREEILALRGEVSELRAQLQTRDKLAFESRCYWIGAGVGRDGPFCQRCFDVEDRLVRLQDGKNIRGGQPYWGCKACEATYSRE